MCMTIPLFFLVLTNYVCDQYYSNELKDIKNCSIHLANNKFVFFLSTLLVWTETINHIRQNYWIDSADKTMQNPHF